MVSMVTRFTFQKMAESLPERDVGDVYSDVQSDNSFGLECAVCLQSCVHPAELPCGHVFCYLCIKGIVNRNRRCAMCRQSIPADFLDKPRLLRPVEMESESKGFDDGHAWFYEGHNGWWQYDERTSSELEGAYQNGERCCEILVAGYVYVADFDSMLQYRRNDTCKRRRIKRDLTTTNKKGVAGLKLARDTTPSTSSSIVSNVLIPGMQNLHISNRSAGLANQPANVFRLHNMIRETHQPETSPPFMRGHAVEPLRPIYPQELQASQTESDADSDDNLYDRASRMEETIHSSLDWTIQQIESLQAQLSSDFDNLTDDADHDYEDLDDDVGRRMSRRNESTSSDNDIDEGNENIDELGSDRSEGNVSPCDDLENSYNSDRSEGNVSPCDGLEHEHNEDTSQDTDHDD